MTLEIGVTTDLDICLHLRHVVFVDEQGVPVEEEQDAHDFDATHLLARLEGHPVGTARILKVGELAKIGRICVVQSARGTGAGRALVQHAVSVARTMPGIVGAQLGAQLHALGFYEKLGFAAFGPVYLDAGIEHRDMALKL